MPNQLTRREILGGRPSASTRDAAVRGAPRLFFSPSGVARTTDLLVVVFLPHGIWPAIARRLGFAPH
jgi:hypothetical protein